MESRAHVTWQGLVLASGLTFLLAAPAAADRFKPLSVSTTSPSVGATLQVTVKATTPACGFRLDLGDGRVVKAAVNGNKVVPVVYDSAGTRTISVTGKKYGNKSACKGSASPVTVNVTGGGQGGLLQRGRAPTGGLKRKDAAPSGGGGPSDSSMRPSAAQNAPRTISVPTCETHPCVQNVTVTPAGDSAHFQITANKIHTAKILVGLQKPVGNRWSSQMGGPKLVATSQALRNPSLVDFLSLEANKDYWYLVEITDEGGRSSFHSGRFSTKGRRVQVTLVKVHANDDGDDTDAGEFRIYVFENGVEKIYAHTDVSTGTSVDLTGTNCSPSCSFVVEQAPPKLRIGLGFEEVDSVPGFGVTFTKGGWDREEEILVEQPGSRTLVRRVTEDDADALLTLRVEVSYD